MDQNKFSKLKELYSELCQEVILYSQDDADASRTNNDFKRQEELLPLKCLYK